MKMTYKEAYMKSSSFSELKDMAEADTKIALCLGGNPDRIKAIEDAMNEVVTEKGWEGNPDG